jgi:hypothetical protein
MGRKAAQEIPFFSVSSVSPWFISTDSTHYRPPETSSTVPDT